MAEPTDNQALAARQIQGWVAERRCALRLAVAAWRLEDARRRPCAPYHRARVFRGRERRYTPVRTAQSSSGSDDPHIDGAPPVAVASSTAAREVA